MISRGSMYVEIIHSHVTKGKLSVLLSLKEILPNNVPKKLKSSLIRKNVVKKSILYFNNCFCSQVPPLSFLFVHLPSSLLKFENSYRLHST
jgi:hypothetical protein